MALEVPLQQESAGSRSNRLPSKDGARLSNAVKPSRSQQESGRLECQSLSPRSLGKDNRRSRLRGEPLIEVLANSKRSKQPAMQTAAAGAWDRRLLPRPSRSRSHVTAPRSFRWCRIITKSTT